MKPRSVTFSRSGPRIEIKISAILGRFPRRIRPQPRGRDTMKFLGAVAMLAAGPSDWPGDAGKGVQAGGEELHQPRSKLDDSLPRA